MKIEKIKIEHFRGILDVELDFDPQLNVFIGGNGAGKTTILTAIAQSLFKLTKSYAKNSNSFFKLSSKDINYTKKYTQVTNFINISDFEEKIPLILTEGIIPKKRQVENEAKNRVLKDFKKYFELRIKKEEFTIPIIKFYPVNRVTNIYRNFSYNRAYKIHQLETWSNLYQDTLSYYNFLKWFFEQETKELRLKRDKNDISVKSKRLTSVRNAVQKAFRILENKDYIIKSDQIKQSLNNELLPILIIEDKETKQSEDLNSKSDGEKSIITLVADIAYNLSIAKNFSEGDDYLSSPGIVLIDEIEAHLHPNWQRAILPLLTELFPNIQFFITTHSPQVLASVESQHVFICEDFKFSKINIKSKGLDSNSLLKYVFNSTERPKKYVDLLEEFDEVIEKQGAIEELENIISKIDDLDAHDTGQDIDLLVSELNLQVEAYKFDLDHETHS